MLASPSLYWLGSCDEKDSEEVSSSVGKQAVWGQWDGGPGTAYVATMTFWGCQLRQLMALE